MIVSSMYVSIPRNCYDDLFTLYLLDNFKIYYKAQQVSSYNIIHDQ